MSKQYAEFLKQHPYIDEEIHRREDELLAKGEAEGKVEVILEMLRIHFSEATAELVKLALRRVDIRDAEVMGPLKEALECDVSLWMGGRKDSCPPARWSEWASCYTPLKYKVLG